MTKKYYFISYFVTIILILGCIPTQPVKIIEKTGIKSSFQPKRLDINAVINKLSQQIFSTMFEKNKRKIAVMNFPLLTGEMTELGLYLSDKLTNSLFQFRDKFEVVERKQVETVLKEMELGVTGLIDEETAQSIGRFIGADAIVIGTVTDLGEEVDINIRMLETEKASVLAVASSFLKKSPAIARLMAKVRTRNMQKQKNIKKAKSKEQPVSPQPHIQIKRYSNKVGWDHGFGWEKADFILELKSIEFLKNGRLKMSFLFTNINSRGPLKFRLNRKAGTYIVDNLGNQYHLYDVNNINFNYKTFPKDIPLKVDFIFPNVNRDAKSVSFFSNIDCGGCMNPRNTWIKEIDIISREFLNAR